MTQNLKVAIVQFQISWENKKKNLELLDEKLNEFNDETDLIVLPEMFATGFSMNASAICEQMNGMVVSWMKEKSVFFNADIAGSVVIHENGNYYNRFIWIKPDGEILSYDKKHLFSMCGEDKVFIKGDRCLTVDLKGWKIRPFICYDLRFPEWLRNFNNEYDIAVFAANWPDARSEHWKTLLRARAIENQCYAIGVNCVGPGGNRLRYKGDSLIINYFGDTLVDAGDRIGIASSVLNKSELDEYRKSFPFWKDTDVEYKR